MSNRETAIVLTRIAGYHNDTAKFVRLIVESRVSRPVLNEAFAKGMTARREGVKCGCFYCRAAGITDTTTPEYSGTSSRTVATPE